MKNDSSHSLLRPGILAYLVIFGSVAVIWNDQEKSSVSVRLFLSILTAFFAYLLTRLVRFGMTKNDTTTKSVVAPSTNATIPPVAHDLPRTGAEWFYNGIAFGLFVLLMRYVDPNWKFGTFPKAQVPPVGTAYPLPLGSRSFLNLKPLPTGTGKPIDLLKLSGPQPSGPMATAPKHDEQTTQVEGSHFRVRVPPGWTRSPTSKNPENNAADVRLQHSAWPLGLSLFAPIPKTLVKGATLSDFAKLHESLKRKVEREVIAVSEITPDELQGKSVLRYELHLKTKEDFDIWYMIYVWETKDHFWSADAFTMMDTSPIFRVELRRVVEGVETKHE